MFYSQQKEKCYLWRTNLTQLKLVELRGLCGCRAAWVWRTQEPRACQVWGRKQGTKERMKGKRMMDFAKQTEEGARSLSRRIYCILSLMCVLHVHVCVCARVCLSLCFVRVGVCILSTTVLYTVTVYCTLELQVLSFWRTIHHQTIKLLNKVC